MQIQMDVLQINGGARGGCVNVSSNFSNNIKWLLCALAFLFRDERTNVRTSERVVWGENVRLKPPTGSPDGAGAFTF